MESGNHGEHVNRKDQPKLLRLIACPILALEHGRIDRYVPAGKTVAGHLRDLGWNPDTLQARVMIDGEYIEQARWEYAVPRAGQSFVTRVIPMGGDGGKDILRIVGMLAVVALAIAGAPYLAPVFASVGFGATTSLGLASAAISIAGSLAITARIPPARPRLQHQRVRHD